MITDFAAPAPNVPAETSGTANAQNSVIASDRRTGTLDLDQIYTSSPQLSCSIVGVALCTGVRCSELVALKWSDFDWQNLSVYIRRAIVSGRVDDVKTEYSEAPLPLDPALAEVIFEWRRKAEFSADSDFVFASPYMAGEKPYTPWNMQHNHLSPAAVKAGLGPIGWHTLRHTYRAWLGDNGEPLTVQKELMRHASIQTTLNTYGGGLMESMREAHGRVVRQAIAR